MATYAFTCNTAAVDEVKDNNVRVSGGNGTIHLSVSAAACFIRICNTAGQTVYENTLNQGNSDLPASPGVYILKIITGEKEHTRKVVVR